MVQYGTPSSFEPRRDHSRIDPTLPVDPRGDPNGTTLGYWPSYPGLDPRARATYLRWLDGARADRSIPIGYVFVFFYGLEQRLFVEEARDEAASIMKEVRRLLALHDDNHSFLGYASKLLALAPFFEKVDETPPTVGCARNYDLEIPLDVRIRLGERLRDGVPFGPDDTLRWVLALPDTYLRTPGERCFDELRELWSRRHVGRYPNGLAIRRPKRTIQHSYRAASGTFTVELSVKELPDISNTTAPLTQLRTMLDECIEDLSSYSRLIGRDPGARGRIRADMLLPGELREDRDSVSACRARLEEATAAEALPTTTMRELADILDVDLGPEGGKVAATVSRQIGAMLDVLDHGCEPDRRYGPSGALRHDAPVALFPCARGGPVEHERPAYASARTLVEVAMLAAAADGQVVRSEIEVTERRLRGLPDLAEHEISRLMAYGRSLAADPPKVRAALKRLADVRPEARSALASSAVEAVLADGRVEPAEVKFLEALHQALGLPLSSLYSSLHRGGIEDVGPVLVAPAKPESLVPIPDEANGATVVSIDLARLERIRGETSQVSALLASIFVEEQPDAAPPAAIPPAADTAFLGLDAAHSDLLARILDAAMTRADFEAYASRLRLMPDGAIETLNEWGFDTFDEPVIEDDETIAVAPHLVDQIKPIGAVA
ncbi:TerB N-terminal domain-containing protein [Sphingomonas sp. CFBP 8760]|nr:TerB N-terminal domain-containing protein [Sphingomonas sp. CFBP 8760]